jgi:hypothetical protein
LQNYKTPSLLTVLHRFGSAIGTPERLTERCVSRNVAYLRGIRAARAVFDRC